MFLACVGHGWYRIHASQQADCQTENHMRLSSFAAAVLIVSMSAPALAQEWKEFESQQDRFTCNFPGDPKITDTTFISQFGHRLPARVYSVELAANHRFSVTVVDYSNITQLGLEKQKACPAGSEACRGGSGAPGNSTGPGYSKADRAGAMILRDVAVHAARREGDASAVDEHQSRRRTPDSPAEQRGQIADRRVGLHARRQALHRGGHGPCRLSGAGAVLPVARIPG